jgi:transglutaminase-like putative cysteine protease
MRRTRRGLGFGLLVLCAGAVLATDAVSAETHDSWDGVYISGAKVGFIHTSVEPVKDRGRDLLRVRQDMEFNFKRLEDRVTIKTMYGTIETKEGSVLKLETRTFASNQQMTATGSVVDGKMTLTLDGGGQRQQVTIPWGPEVRGPYAAEQSLSRSPMKPGESRDVRMYVPDLNKICDIKLVAKAIEDVTLGDGKRPLLRIDEIVSLETKPMPEYNTTLWVDSAGQVLKSRSEILGGLDIYRTTREGARLGGDQASLNLTLSSIVKVTHKIAKPETRRDITYRVALKEDDPASILPTDRRQSLRAGTSKNSSVLVVKTARPTDGEAGPEQVAPEFLRANTLISSEDLKVKKLAAQATAAAVDPWDKAVKITRWVAQNLKDKNFETAFAPASEVAETLSGDCTEHGVLVAAMCRAVGVPSRVVVGLVYSDSLGGFGFHMWNEVYVNRRWVAVDAAFDQTEVDAVHIKLADTSLDGVSPYEAFLPVVRVLGKMTLEPVELR